MNIAKRDRRTNTLMAVVAIILSCGALYIALFTKPTLHVDLQWRAIDECIAPYVDHGEVPQLECYGRNGSGDRAVVLLNGPLRLSDPLNRNVLVEPVTRFCPEIQDGMTLQLTYTDVGIHRGARVVIYDECINTKHF